MSVGTAHRPLAAAFAASAVLSLLLLQAASVAARTPLRLKVPGPRLFERPLGSDEALSSARGNNKRGIWPPASHAKEPVESVIGTSGQTPSAVKGAVPVVDPPRRIAGYFLLDRTKDARMFYFLFRSRSLDTDPLVLWMTGGPGCSSELAVFYENGPYVINDDMTLNETQYGWDKYHNLLYVDQPINTGFSYSNDDVDRVYNEAGVSEDMLDFLQEFFKVHPDLAERDLYITGESYGGHYVPAVSHRVWLENRNVPDGPQIKLKGIAIGNGLTNPEIQYNAYADFAFENKLIDAGVRDSINWWYPVCRWTVRLCNSYPWRPICSFSLYWCQSSTFGAVMDFNKDMNVYDITKKCDAPLCYDFSNADAFLNNVAVQAQLGVSYHEWQACNYDVNADMQGDIMRSYHELLPEMLADGVRIMIYAGDRDFICNWIGNSRWVAALQWPGQQDWALAPEHPWENTRGQAAGTVKEVGPLSFVRVFKAGHMVPMDQPENGLEMITKFTRNVSLAGEVAAHTTGATTLRASTEGGEPALRQRAGGSAANGGGTVEPGSDQIRSSAVAGRGQSLAGKLVKLVLGRHQPEDEGRPFATR